jgi:hypothetical protein
MNNSFQTCYNNWEQVCSANTTCRQLVNRFLATYLQICKNLCVLRVYSILSKYNLLKCNLKYQIHEQIKQFSLSYNLIVLNCSSFSSSLVPVGSAVVSKLLLVHGSSKRRGLGTCPQKIAFRSL